MECWFRGPRENYLPTGVSEDFGEEVILRLDILISAL